MGVCRWLTITTSLVTLLLAFHLYSPVPSGLEAPWITRTYIAAFRLADIIAFAAEKVTGMSRMDALRWQIEALYIPLFHSDSDVQVENLRFDGIPVRVYRPVTASKSGPGIVFFHGGGWSLFSVDSYDLVTLALAKQTQAVVISVDFRLAPEKSYPVPFDDCVKATRYVLHHGQAIGVDSHRMAVAGDGSGANLAAAVALRLSEEDPEFIPHLKLQTNFMNPYSRAMKMLLMSKNRGSTDAQPSVITEPERLKEKHDTFEQGSPENGNHNLSMSNTSIHDLLPDESFSIEDISLDVCTSGYGAPFESDFRSHNGTQNEGGETPVYTELVSCCNTNGDGNGNLSSTPRMDEDNGSDLTPLISDAYPGTSQPGNRMDGDNSSDGEGGETRVYKELISCCSMDGDGIGNISSTPSMDEDKGRDHTILPSDAQNTSIRQPETAQEERSHTTVL